MKIPTTQPTTSRIKNPRWIARFDRGEGGWLFMHRPFGQMKLGLIPSVP